MIKEPKISILFVCMGNICRSPTAEGVFRKHLQDAGLMDVVMIDSAGTHAYHIGEPADRRAAQVAERRGFSLEGIRARRLRDDDYERFDLILAMDQDNLGILTERSPETARAEIRLFLEYAGGDAREVPDPYYGGTAGFERVLDLIEDASGGLIRALQERTGAGTRR
ncbi:MAG: low molecular weight protein-tyrosine-phosphatase [Woeseiaceae bacterium]|nr:low molecular weight protein-tyrosine-phosphatase [Woeseiaceae bacterium]